MPFKNDTEMILKGYVDEIPHILLFFYNKSRKNETGGSEMYPTYMPYQYPQRQDYRQPMQPVIPQNNPGFNCLPVTSKAEAEVFQIPFDGTTTYFVDTANGKIYAKTFNATTGAAPLVTFSRDAEVVVRPPQYVTMEDFNALKEEIERLKKPTKKEKQNDTD